MKRGDVVGDIGDMCNDSGDDSDGWYTGDVRVEKDARDF